MDVLLLLMISVYCMELSTKIKTEDGDRGKKIVEIVTLNFKVRFDKTYDSWFDRKWFKPL